MADLTTLYRGVGNPFHELIPKSFEGNIGQGRWWSTNPVAAQKYAQGLLESPTPRLGGAVYSMDVDPTKALSKSEKFRQSLVNRGYDLFENHPSKGWNPNTYIATKELLKEGKPSINWGQTLKTNLGALGNRGLGFLKNNALRTLAMLGSLPFQAGIMTLAPTKMGSAELPQMPQGSPRQQTLQAQVTAQANREARERVGRGEARDYGHTQTRSSSGWRSDPMWKGGIVDLYRYGGFI